VAITDSTFELLTYTLSSLGVTKINLSNYHTAFSDAGNVVVSFLITNDGILKSYDVI
jgi:hypothetical protein